MFARQLDVNKVVKQDLKMTNLWVKLVPKSLTKGMTLIVDLKRKSSKVFYTFNTQSLFLLIALKGSKTDSDRSSLRPF